MATIGAPADETLHKLIAMDLDPFEPMSGEAFPLRVKVASAALSETIIEELDEKRTAREQRLGEGRRPQG